MNIIDDLMKLQDIKYKDFNCSLIPSRPKDFFIGVRLPLLKEYVKKNKEKLIEEGFMNELPHKYYEEYLIHRFLIQGLKEYDRVVYEIDRLLPYFESWAETDGFKNNKIEKNLDDFLKYVKKWIVSDHAYTRRFGIDMLMTYYIKDNFKEEYLYMVAGTKSNDEYYVDMMKSWYFATTLIDHYEETLKCINEANLSDFVYNKSIQKAIESFRISDEKKEYLRSIKRSKR